MNRFVKRAQLEEIMFSFMIENYNEEDIEFINQVYSDYMNNMYIFELANTEQYFKEFIITYCQQNCNTIINNVHFTDINNRNKFISNFGEGNHNQDFILEIPAELNQPLLNENHIEINKIVEEEHKRYKKYYIIGGIALIGILGIGYYFYKQR